MDRRIKKTNTAIFNAYTRAKKAHPEAEPSVKEICAIADINKTTFYRYFTDVRSLSRSFINHAINKLLIEDIRVEKLLSEPETYFRQILVRFKQNEKEYSVLILDNPNTFIYEAERILRSELKKTTGNKYDDVLMTFIAGGAAHYFLSANYTDETELTKFCRIIKAATTAI